MSELQTTLEDTHARGEASAESISLTFVPSFIHALREHFGAARLGASATLSSKCEPLEAAADDVQTACQDIVRAQELALAAIQSHTNALLSATRRRHNRNQPISRLPNEVVAMIFELAERHATNPVQPLESRVPLNVARVSTCWRDVALSTSKLWRRIDRVNASLAPLYLLRSRATPLEIDLIPPQSCTTTHNAQVFDLATIHILTPHVSRWGSLKLTIQGLENDFYCCLGVPAPELHELVLLDSGHGYDYVMPCAIFAGNAPRLRNLALYRVRLSLESALYQGLTTLSLEHIWFRASTPDHFLANLEACPCLEELTLHLVWFSKPLEPHLLIPLRLPYLKRLTTSSLREPETRYIFNSICVPPGLNLDVDTDHSLDSIFPQQAVMAKRFPNICLARSLIISLEWFRPIIRDGERLHPRFQFSFPRSNISSIVSSIGRCLLLPHLEDLTLVGLSTCMLSPEDFAILLLCSPTVKRLKLTQCTTPFLDALVITSDRHLCPLLQSLHLTNSTFDGSYLVALARLRATSRHHPGVPGASDDAGLRLITLWKCDRIGAEGEDNIRKLSITLDYVDFNLVR